MSGSLHQHGIGWWCWLGASSSPTGLYTMVYKDVVWLVLSIVLVGGFHLLGTGIDLLQRCLRVPVQALSVYQWQVVWAQGSEHSAMV